MKSKLIIKINTYLLVRFEIKKSGEKYILY